MTSLVRKKVQMTNLNEKTFTDKCVRNEQKDTSKKKEKGHLKTSE